MISLIFECGSWYLRGGMLSVTNSSPKWFLRHEILYLAPLCEKLGSKHAHLLARRKSPARFCYIYHPLSARKVRHIPEWYRTLYDGSEGGQKENQEHIQETAPGTTA